MDSGFEAWVASAGGRQTVASEIPALRRFMRQMVGPVVVQLGRFGGQAVIEDYGFPLAVTLAGEFPDGGESGAPHRVAASADALPLAADQVSGVVCPHVLEYANPHRVLREIKRVLQPEGQLLLTGFNPWSPLGMAGVVRRRAPWHGSFISLNRLSDWLRLLEFDIQGSAMCCFSASRAGREPGKVARFFDRAGDRWWPMLGGVYVLLARKREAGVNWVGLKPQRRVARGRVVGGTLVRKQFNPDNHHIMQEKAWTK